MSHDIPSLRLRVTRARTKLLLSHPFFGALALRLKVVITENPVPGQTDTAWTDGTVMGFSADFLTDKVTDSELVGLLAHEVMHCAMGHQWRRGLREHGRWNDACDYAINPIIADAGMDLPSGGGLQDEEFRGMSAERIYTMLLNNPPGGGGGSGDGSPRVGIILDAGTGGDGGKASAECLSESEWKVAAAQAAQAAKMAGKLPGSIEELIEGLLAPVVNWREVLAQFLQQHAARNDFTMRVPDRRYAAHGLYMPTLHSEVMPPLMIAVDTSGSVDTDTLQRFLSEIQSASATCHPERIVVLTVDTKVQGRFEFEPGEEIVFPCKGRGGTSFTPAFDALKQEGEEFCAMLYFTDGYASWPEESPDIPLLWVLSETDPEPPYGESIYVGSDAE